MKMNLPNKLTLFRLCAVPAYILFIMVPIINETWSRVIACAIFVLAALSDFLDGLIARKMNLVSDFGKFVDPIADKFMIIGAYSAMAASSSYRDVYWFVFIGLIIVVFRELAVTSMRLLAASSDDHAVISANIWGKLKTITQCLSVIILIIEPLIVSDTSSLSKFRIFSLISVILMSAATLWSGYNYFRTYKQYIFKPKEKDE